jgi:hypothetical protein
MLAGLLRRARTEGITRGLIGGNRLWLVVGGLAWGAQALRWAVRREEEVVFREVLEPGEQLVITAREPSARRGRARGAR